MSELYAVEIEPEVRTWLEALSDRDFGRVDFLVGLLAEQADTRRIVLLTVFAKTRGAETAEVERAQKAQKNCERRHQIAHEAYERKVT
jgi:hypothetical protein